MAVFESKDDLIVAGTLYIEDVEAESVGIEQAVQELVVRLGFSLPVG